jgi:hypothetical protein
MGEGIGLSFLTLARFAGEGEGEGSVRAGWYFKEVTHGVFAFCLLIGFS